MAIALMYITIILTIAVAIPITTAAGLKEVCQWEKFEAKCQKNEVIMIKEAHYGRMGVGRCQPRDFGFAGCSADVSTIMHARCSGRKYCSVSVPDPTMFAATPCPKDLVTYLQADYECIKVAKFNTDNCGNQILTSLNGDIAKQLIKTSVCPHRILAQPGQSVNVYLYDFYDKNSGTGVKPECINYGYVSEDSNTPIKICGGEFRKNHLLYSSDSNMVDITLTEESSHPHHFLLHYEVVGCPALQAPPNAWMKVEDNTAVVMCNFSHIASNLVCSDNEWIGDVQNCTSIDTEFLMASSLSVTSLSDIVANTGMFAVICVGLSCGVVFSIGLLALIKARRGKAKQITELPQTAFIEKPASSKNEKLFKSVDDYQPVYLPITTDNYGQYTPMAQNSLYQTPRPSVLSTLQAPHLMVTDYVTTLDTCIPVSQNIYSALGSDQKISLHNSGHQLYDLAALSHTLGREKIITIDEADLS